MNDTKTVVSTIFWACDRGIALALNRGAALDEGTVLAMFSELALQVKRHAGADLIAAETEGAIQARGEAINQAIERARGGAPRDLLEQLFGFHNRLQVNLLKENRDRQRSIDYFDAHLDDWPSDRYPEARKLIVEGMSYNELRAKEHGKYAEAIALLLAGTLPGEE